MLLKLVLPEINKTIQKGKIIKWYKQPGDWIDYGDDLCKIFFEKDHKNNRTGMVKDILSQVSKPKNLSPPTIRSTQQNFQIGSSDTGFLRSIKIPEQGEVDNGYLLALISSEANELIEILEADLIKVCSFRIVVNYLT